MISNLLKEFGNTIDWIAVTIVTVVFLLLIIFLIGFVFYMLKSPNKTEENLEAEHKKDKIEKMLDKQNKNIKRYHTRCKVCGSKVNKLSGKCTFCGARNFDDENKKMH